MLIDQPINASDRVSGSREKTKTLTQSVSVRTNKLDISSRKERIIPDNIHDHVQQDYEEPEIKSSIPRSNALNSVNDLDFDVLNKKAVMGSLGDPQKFVNKRKTVPQKDYE